MPAITTVWTITTVTTIILNYNYDYGYNNYNESDVHIAYGYLYYILSDSSYYVNYNGRWVRGGDYNNNNGGSNNTLMIGYEILRNAPHYRYENDIHYYLKDNGRLLLLFKW